MEVYIIEAQLTDHPDYETFVAVKSSLTEAEQLVVGRLQEEIDDLGEGEVVRTEINDRQVRLEVSDDGSVMFITRHEV